MRLARVFRAFAWCLAAAVLVVAGCSNNNGEDDGEAAPDVEPLGDAPPPDEDAEPEPDPEPEPETEPNPEPDDEPDVTQLYSPLPDLAPDSDNDIPDAFEAEILEVYEAAYDLIRHAYATGEIPDESEIRTYYAPEPTRILLEDMRYLAGEGLAERSHDTEVKWVRVTAFSSGTAATRECRIVGETAGLYDLESGELVEASEPGPRTLERLWALEVDDGGDARWIIDEFSFIEDRECV